MSNSEFKDILTKFENSEGAYIIREINGEEYIRRFEPKPRLIILGGGHIAVPLCTIAWMVGFDVVVADDRPDFANKGRFADAVSVICDGFESAINSLDITNRDYVCVITRGHRWDHLCIRKILSNNMPYYLGMIGSKRRVEGLFEQLKEDGIDAEKIKAINAPIGLKIGAVTPAEIAVSIVSQLILFKNQNAKKIDKKALQQADADIDMLKFLANSNEPRAMIMVLSSTGSTPVKPGAMMALDYSTKTYGTIGGGCSEAAAVRKARNIIGTGESCVIDIDMTNDVAEETGMVCGGTMKVLIEDIN